MQIVISRSFGNPSKIYKNGNQVRRAFINCIIDGSQRISFKRSSQYQCFVHLVSVGGHFRIIRKLRTSSIFAFCPFSLLKKCSSSQIDKPQHGRPKRAELLDVNINTGAQSINTERAS